MWRLFWVCIGCLVSFSPILAQASGLEGLPDCGFAPLDDGSGMRIGAVIINFETGAGCVQALDERFNVASVPKIFVAGAYYDWMVQGLVSTNSPITFAEDYYMGGRNDCLRQEDIGSTFTALELIEMMINCSDNAATWLLMDAVGWLTVNNYIQQTGIPNIGEVVPYSEVDRLKLALLDAKWDAVPRGVASRYYRAGLTGELGQYMTDVPTARLNPNEEYLANTAYFSTTSYNTLTPRALADYFIQLREALIHDPTSNKALVARLLFDVMLYTQRLNSVQAFDGSVLVGSKNGFDRGLVAEVNLVFEDVSSLIPTGMILVFTQQSDLSAPTVQPASFFRGTLNDYLRDLSPRINQILYPNAIPLAPTISFKLSSVTLQQQSNIQACWDSYFLADFAEEKVDGLEQCFTSYPSLTTFGYGENVSLGLVLRGLNNADTRLVFVFTAPDGTRASYQTDREYQDKSAIYWYHPVEQVGVWQLDIYLNLERVYSQTFTVQ